MSALPATATIARRFWASVIDGLVALPLGALGAFGALLMYPGVENLENFTNAFLDGEPWVYGDWHLIIRGAALLAFVFAAVFTGLYFVFTIDQIAKNGETFGMARTRVRIMDARTGKKVGAERAAKRGFLLAVALWSLCPWFWFDPFNAAAVLPTIWVPLIFVACAAPALVRNDRRALWDLVAGTAVYAAPTQYLTDLGRPLPPLVGPVRRVPAPGVPKAPAS